MSNITNLVLSEEITVFELFFGSTSSSYTITCPPGQFFIVGDGGIVQESGALQNIVAAVDEFGNAGGFQISGGSAGDSTVFTAEARSSPTGASGNIQFTINASAGSATVMNKGGAVSGADGGETIFVGLTTAATATITNEGGTVSGASGGLTWFAFEPTSAGDAVITSEGASVSGAFGGTTRFDDVSKADNATLIAHGGSNGGGGGLIEFLSKSKGGTARIMIYDNAILDVGAHDGSLSIGSLEGDGQVLLGRSTALSVGSNNLNTIFAGVIQDSGSLTKIGTGTLTLTGASTYTKATTVSAGALFVNNTTGSATGPSPVKVSAGTLGGGGTIAGTVTIGTGSGAGAFLTPAFGSDKQVTLTLQSNLTLQADATYNYTFRSKGKKFRADEVIANTVNITGASINVTGTATEGRLRRGTVLTVISNTSFNPINGTFINLPDGAIITAGNNSFQASYSGGDGNDLTLTVVRE